MARPRYQIWDEVSKVITPSGKVFTAEQWMEEWPMAREKSVELVISGSTVNGSFCAVYDDFVDMYEEMGCDFSACETKQDHLNAIETFEKNRNSNTSNAKSVSAEERIAAALEAQVMLAMPDEEEV